MLLGMRSTLLSSFSPIALFASGEPGGWYDPSDLTTLFQDSAGTTPVTAVEQPVGLMLDKSRGLALGPELVTNGDFSNGSTGWTLGSGVSVSSGQAVFTNVGNQDGIYRGSIASAGKVYSVSYTCTTLTGGSFAFYIGGTQGKNRISTGSFTEYIAVPSSSSNTNAGVFATFTGTTAAFDNISVKELPGAHLTQSTSTARPVLSARVNLLTRTEDFSQAVWIAGTGASKAAAKITNTSTTNAWVYQSVDNLPLSKFTASVEFQKDTARYAQLTLGYSTNNRRYAVLLDLETGLFVDDANTTTALTEKSYAITIIGNGWYRLSVSGTGASGTAFIVVACTNSLPVTRNVDLDFTNATNGVAVNIRNADLRVANDTAAPVYQRVTTATDYATTGFPLYLRFDGTDDFMVCPTITPGIDKAQVFAGVRKLSDAATGVVAETSSDSAANNGTIALAAPAGASSDYFWRSKGTSSASGTTSASYPAPITSVMTGLGDISADISRLRYNGTQILDITSDQGTGNYLAYPMYVGARGGTSLRFNGRLYPLIVRFGANLTDTQIAQTESYVSTQMGGGYVP